MARASYAAMHVLESRFDPRNDEGFYESYFQRGNHPRRPLAFWIRYTVFSPRGRPDAARGELWAIYFDGERSRIVAVKQDHPLAHCSFARDRFDVRVAQAQLSPGRLEGHAASLGHELSWSLTYAGDERPLLLLPERLYDAGFPKAKSLVPTPHARYAGTLTVDGERIEIDGWPGSQNHNWGSRHTDEYRWGQVCGFDDDERAFLECASARVRLGPLLSPTFSVLVLRLGDEELRANALSTALRARTTIDGLDWRISTACGDTQLEAHLHAAADAFVALGYDNPPGGTKLCRNTKLAAAELVITRRGHAPLRLSSAHRAAFEILSDAP